MEYLFRIVLTPFFALNLAAVAFLASCDLKQETTKLSRADASVSNDEPSKTGAVQESKQFIEQQEQAGLDLGITDIQKPISTELNPIQVRVNKAQYSDPNLMVKLTGWLEDANTESLSKIVWTQIQGPSAFIFTPDSLNTEILLPVVSQPETLSFRLAVVNQDNYVNSAVSKVYINPLYPPIQISNVATVENGSARFKVTLLEPALEAFSLS